jgi:hypothetical protein
MPSGEAINTNSIVLGLIQQGLEPTIYHTRGEHANLYSTDAVHTDKWKLYKTKILIRGNNAKTQYRNQNDK